jgi:hypothetical protein
LLPVVGQPASGDAAYDTWLETNVKEQKQTGYAAVTVTVDQGNLTGDQLRGWPSSRQPPATACCARRSTRMWCSRLFRWLVCRRSMPHCANSAWARRAGQIDDVLTCPGAYTCNLGITKTMNLGAALQDAVRQYDDPRVRQLTIKASGCPNACGHHWIADFGFYGNARKIDSREVPYYQTLLGGGYDEQGIMRFGLAVQSIPARLGPEAIQRVIAHFQANRLDGESFRDYVLRHKIETFRELTADLAKPADLFPEIYQDWGDTEDYSLKFGRGECAV